MHRFVDGMDVHVVSGVEMDDLTTSFTIGPGVSIFLLLEGYVSITVDGETWELGADESVNGFCGTVWARSRDVRVERHIRRGRHVEKIAITLQPDWFDALEAAMPAGFSAFLARHKAEAQWAPSARAVRNGRDIVWPLETTPLQRRLGVQQRALQIVQEALALFDADDAHDLEQETGLARRAAGVRAFLDETLDRDLTLGALAREIGMSVTALQDGFRQSFGMTIGEYRRRQKLIRANMALRDDGVTVAKAAELAGYSNPANFATAFSREFGYPPSKARG